MNKKVIIYVFSGEDGVPKYVGKAINLEKRIKQHYKDRFKYDTYFYRWLNKCVSLNLPHFIDVLEECNSENWQDREKFWIAHIKECGYPLTNMTDGGDGNNNQVFSIESRLKRSKSLTGRKRTREECESISKGSIGKKVSEKTREKLRIINMGKKCPESVKKVLSKPVIQRDMEGNFIKEFESLVKAANMLNCRKSSLSNAIKRNKNGKFAGYLWNYKTK